jgi:hypothetical protein
MATQARDNVIKKWKGDLSSSINPKIFKIDKDKLVTI